MTAHFSRSTPKTLFCLWQQRTICSISQLFPESFVTGSFAGSVISHALTLGKVGHVRVNYISRVPDQNGVSLLYIMLEIHHSGWVPLIYFAIFDLLEQCAMSVMMWGFFSVHLSVCFVCFISL